MFRTKSRESTGSKASRLSKKELKMQHARDPMTGRPGHLDPGQEHQLKKFRQVIEEKGIYNPERHDEACLCRFLRARKWDFDASLAMFEASEKWRKEFKVDELYQDRKSTV